MAQTKAAGTEANGTAVLAETPDREQAIRARAYALWEAEGCPDGRHEDHWLMAEQEEPTPATRPNGVSK